MAQKLDGTEEYNSDWNKFIAAVEREDVKTIIKLVRKPTIFWQNPLEVAISKNKTKAIQTLLHCNIDPNKVIGPIHNTPLHLAVLNGDLETVKALLTGGADLEKMNIHLYTPFLTALENGNEEILSFFVNNFAFWKNSLNLKLWVKPMNQCPILGLLRNRSPRAWKHLAKVLQGGVETNIANQLGNTPLLEVLYTKEASTAAKIIRSLAAHGAKGNYVNSEGVSPLFKSVMLAEPQILRALFEIDSIDINITNMFRLTPLFYAVSNSKNIDVIKILMKAGANPLIEAAFTMRGKIVDAASAMLQALVMERIEVVEVFLEYGYTVKRKWFNTTVSKSIAWSRATHLSKQVPTLKALARKSVKKALAAHTKIPKWDSITVLELPVALASYISFT